MKIFDYSDKRLILLGDIHGEFNVLKNLLKMQAVPKEKDERRILRGMKKYHNTNLENCAIVICGDCGFGFNKPQYYIEELTKLQKMLEVQNNILLFLRGNHDDPDYFNTSKYEMPFENIKFVPDYSILKTQSDISLCIGGAISIDREWRKNMNIFRNRYKSDSKRLIYWEKEFIHPNDNLVSECLESGLKINSIISHTVALQFLENGASKFNDCSWLAEDNELQKDLDIENKLLEDVYNKLVNNCKFTIEWWACGHMHEGIFSQIKDKKDKITDVYVLNIYKGTTLNNYADITTMQRGYITVFPCKTSKEKEGNKLNDYINSIYSHDNDPLLNLNVPISGITMPEGTVHYMDYNPLGAEDAMADEDEDVEINFGDLVVEERDGNMEARIINTTNVGINEQGPF